MKIIKKMAFPFTTDSIPFKGIFPSNGQPHSPWFPYHRDAILRHLRVITVNSVIALVLTTWMCSNTIDILGDNLSITRVSHLLCVILYGKHYWSRKLHPAQRSHTGITHLQHPPAMPMDRTCSEPHLSLAGVTTFHHLQKALFTTTVALRLQPFRHTLPKHTWGPFKETPHIHWKM